MKSSHFIFLLLIIVFVVSVHFNFNTYRLELVKNDPVCKCGDIQNCFFKNYTNIDKINIPKIFVHISDERNARKWLDFGSRTTNELNLDICVLCIESLISYCGEDCEIILYTNNDVKKIINDEGATLCNIEHPELLGGIDLKQWETYCKFKILEKYGGVVMDPYFMFRKKPDSAFFYPQKMTISNIVNEGVNISNSQIVPNICHMVSSPKKDKELAVYIEYLEKLCTDNYSAEHRQFDKHLNNLLAANSFSSEMIGTVDAAKNPIYLDALVSNQNIVMSNDNICLFIDIGLLKKREKYGWILKMNADQLRSSNMFMIKYTK